MPVLSILSWVCQVDSSLFDRIVDDLEEECHNGQFEVVKVPLGYLELVRGHYGHDSLLYGLVLSHVLESSLEPDSFDWLKIVSSRQNADHEEVFSTENWDLFGAAVVAAALGPLLTVQDAQGVVIP